MRTKRFVIEVDPDEVVWQDNLGHFARESYDALLNEVERQGFSPTDVFLTYEFSGVGPSAPSRTPSHESRGS